MPPFVDYPDGLRCHVCNLYKRSKTAHTIDNKSLCKTCIKGRGLRALFEAAVECEQHWPVMFGGTTVLNIDDFEYVLGEEFAARYRQKEIEYNAPKADRTCCQNSVLEKDKPPSGASASKCIALRKEDVEKLIKEQRKYDIVECAACVSDEPQEPGTKMTCWSCKGETVSAGATESDSSDDQEHKGPIYSYYDDRTGDIVAAFVRDVEARLYGEEEPDSDDDELNPDDEGSDEECSGDEDDEEDDYDMDDYDDDIRDPADTVDFAAARASVVMGWHVRPVRNLIVRTLFR